MCDEEAEKPKNSFKELSTIQKNQLLDFINSL
ncbi:MAG: hypothetical protein ACI9L6_001408 [Flavobacterium sp.]|jgi:hypothetical protein